MSTLNKATWQSKFSDFINRVAPFNAQPLIQKSEHLTVVGTDLGDSAIFRVATVGTGITSPAAAFGVNFANGDRYNIDTSGSGSTAYTITLSGLNENETGILNITKNSGDTFTFAAGIVMPFNTTEGQVGVTALRFFVKLVDTSYVIMAGYNNIVNTANIKDDAVTTAKILNSNVTTAKIADGNVTFAKLQYPPSVAAFTPDLEFGGGSTGMTYSYRNGTYVKVPVTSAYELVHFDLSFVLTAKGSSTGDITINTTLPAPAAGARVFNVLILGGVASGERLVATMDGSSVISIFKNQLDSDEFQSSSVNNVFGLTITGSYLS